MSPRRIIVRGRVQGVGFRIWARDTAARLGLRGRVRNLPSGAVEVVVAGDPEALRQFTDLLRSGPPAARVDTLEETATDEEPLDPFTIVH